MKKSIGEEIKHESVKKRAYEIYMKRIGATEYDDWLEASNELQSNEFQANELQSNEFQTSVCCKESKKNEGDISIDAMKIKVIYWQKKWKIPESGWTICGYSRSAFRTGFYISELELMLDAGPQNVNKPKTILITHTHIDHIACLPMTLIDSKSVVQIYGPVKAESSVTNYINAMFSVNAMANIHMENLLFKYNGVCGGVSGNGDSVFDLIANNTSLKIEVFKCDHAIPTISYGISEIKSKLKEEYKTCSVKDIISLKASGVQITEFIITKKFAYVCDTSIKVFEMNLSIIEYPVIFIECTFLYEDELQNAKDTKHIHWSQLKQIVLANPSKIFMLFHFSQRYRDSDIESFFLKENIHNIHWW